MAFFLKKSTLKGRTYLSIVESYYSPQKHGGAHRTYKSLASVETWKAKGIDDPIAYFQKEVDELNKNNKNPSLEVITIFFRTTFKPFISICRFYRLFLYF